MHKLKNDPKEIVSSFVQEELSGDIVQLKNYCFADLKKTPWGKCNSGFDCDNTLLANAIYVLLWGGKGNFYPDLTLESVGTGRFYRGDTMNSFRSALGNLSKEENRLYWENICLRDEVCIFFNKYHTIGNFTVLPNRAYEKNTFNMARGCKFGDFFDVFLLEMEKVLNGVPNQCDVLAQLVNANFEDFSNRTLSDFAKALLWEDYMDTDCGKPVTIFKDHHTFRSKIRSSEPEKYCNFAKDYISKATQIIDHRTDRILVLLQEKLR